MHVLASFLGNELSDIVNELQLVNADSKTAVQQETR
jgi:hypothetical protein